MVERKTPGEIILLVFIYAAVTLVGFVCLYPMLYCLAASFSDTFVENVWGMGLQDAIDIVAEAYTAYENIHAPQ